MDRRISKTKAAIRRAYLELLRSRKNKKITVSDIAREADIDRKTFYLHYETPDDILNEIYDTEIEKALEKLRSRPAKEDGTEAIADLFEVMTAMIAENLEIFEILSARNADKALFEQLGKKLIEILDREYKDTLGLNETQFSVYSEFFISGILSVYNLWIRRKLPVRIDQLASMVTRASFTGIEGLMSKKV